MTKSMSWIDACSSNPGAAMVTKSTMFTTTTTSSSSSSSSTARSKSFSRSSSSSSSTSWTRCHFSLMVSLVLLLQSTTVHTVTALSSISLPLPQFAFKMLINDTNVDFYLLRNHLTHATDDHLSKVFASQGAIGSVFQGLHLESTIQRTQERDSSVDTKVVVESIFKGSAVFWDSAQGPLDTNVVHKIVAKAFVGNSYWSLMHLFVEDPQLAVVSTLEVVIDTSVLNDDNNSNNNNNNSNNNASDTKTEKAVVSVLTIFSVILIGSTCFLLLVAYRRYYGSDTTSCHDWCSSLRGASCSFLHKRSDSTDDEDEHDPEENFKDENQLPRMAMPQKKMRKSRRVKPTSISKTDIDGIHLDSIVEDEDEEEEENLADVPLDNLILI